MPKEIAGVKVYELGEIAETLKMDRETLLRKIRNGELKAQRVGRSYHVTEGHLREWLESGRKLSSTRRTLSGRKLSSKRRKLSGRDL